MNHANRLRVDDAGDTYRARLSACGVRLEDLRLAVAAELERRDRIIVEWVEAGATNRDAARAARISEARVIAILAHV